MIKSFSSYIVEDISLSKNIHIHHIEDIFLEEGFSGLIKSIEILKKIVNQLISNEERSIQIKTKWDGSPSLVVGLNPENKNFFVGTKSVFAKNPKINYTDEDIDKNHPEEGLNKKLKYALKYLPKLKIKKILQGDILYTKKDLKVQKINGIDYVVFKANTITYAVPRETNLAKEILESKIGIIFHTEYSGNSLDSLVSSLNIDLSDLKRVKDVWFRDADFENINKKIFLSKFDEKILLDYISKLEKFQNKLDKILIDTISETPLLKNNIMMFNNLLIRLQDLKYPSKNMVKKLVDFILKKKENEIDKLKTDKGKERKREEYDKILDIIKTNEDQFVLLYDIQKTFEKMKSALLKILEQVQSIGSYVESDRGYSVTSPEGYVILSDDHNTVVKLIDRNVFSFLNFNIQKDWKK